MQPTVTLSLLWTPLCVCRLGIGAAVPAEAWEGEFCSMVREDGGVSLICDSAQLPGSFNAERDWRAVRIEEVSQLGDAEARATVSRSLRAAGVRALDLEGDVLLIKDEQLHDAVVALERAGFLVEV